MFYEFRQNNSGGSFDIEPDRGISVSVIVEADSVEDANYRAERIGLYFNGCEDGRDCDCCGDRWHEQYQFGDREGGDVVPSVYGKPLIDHAPDPKQSWIDDGWAGDDPEVFVHLKDGRFFGFHLVNGYYIYTGDALPETLPAGTVKEIEA